jgi:hypothetical protein
MKAKSLYQVYPSIPPSLENFKGGSYFDTDILWYVLLSDFFITVGFAAYNFFAGGYFWLIFLLLGLLLYLKIILTDKKNSNISLIENANENSSFLSQQLNDILIKSEEIVTTILPFYEESSKKSIAEAKIDFSENAISPFWDRIEEASKSLACFQQAVDQLILNGEIYSKILNNKRHNFPIPFPIGAPITISQKILDDFFGLIRKAQTKFEFANIWEHRKTQKILIAGFSTLEQAISTMNSSIINAIWELEQSIKSEFRELKNIQFEQVANFKAENKALSNTLASMDTKLYFLQYNKRPVTPFVRPLSDYLH